MFKYTAGMVHDNWATALAVGGVSFQDPTVSQHNIAKSLTQAVKAKCPVLNTMTELDSKSEEDDSDPFQTSAASAKSPEMPEYDNRSRKGKLAASNEANLTKRSWIHLLIFKNSNRKTLS
ncbi:hypothetical protein LTR08_002027 [Meristemomyces frigidus]|nr:hypothetical protein LTR08_002027 [Meristemomyces frigidus]